MTSSSSSPGDNKAASATTITARESPFSALKNKLQSVSSTLVASVSSSSTHNSLSDDPEFGNNKTDTQQQQQQQKRNLKSSKRRRRNARKIVFLEYEVNSGDTISSIAAKFDTTPSELCSINRLFSRHLFPGQKLKIPDKIANENNLLQEEEIQQFGDDDDDEMDEEDKNAFDGGTVGGNQDGDDQAFESSDKTTITTTTPTATTTTTTLLENTTENHEEEENDPCARQYIKVEGKYVTEREGTIGGCLLITPNMFMFSPWCSDPVVMEYGIDQFTVEFPIAQIRSIAMYNNPSVMFFDRRKRTKSDCLIAQQSSSPDRRSAALDSTVIFPNAECNLPIKEEDDDKVVVINKETIVESEKKVVVEADVVAVANTDDDGAEEEDKEVEKLNLSIRENNEKHDEEGKRGNEVNIPPPSSSARPHSSSSPPPLATLAAATATTTTTGTMIISESPSTSETFSSLDDKISLSLSMSSNLPGSSRRQIFSSLPYYLCITSPYGYRETKCSTMIRDEYWFMIPQTEGISLCEFLMNSGVPQYGNEIPDDLRSTAVGNADTPRRGPSFIQSSHASFEPGTCKTTTLSDADKRQRFKLRQESMTWELVNVDDCHQKINVRDADPENLPLPELTEESCILSEQKIRDLLLNLPPGAEGCNWFLVYSTWRDGCSLKTLYRQGHSCDKPCLLVIQDEEDNIFGALLSDKIKISDLFYGRGETYVFRWNPHFQKFRWTGENSFFIKGSPTTLTIGCSNGQSALWLDDRLYRGRSQQCETFHSPTLPANGHEDFLIHFLEVWSFS